MDDNKADAMVLLDLSADHSLLLKRLHHTFGICDKALSWVSSYLQNRSFRVSIGESRSSPLKLHFGIPQGSVVGPFFFVLYTCCIGTIIHKYDIMYHLYADDVQLYLPFDPKAKRGFEHAVETLSSCISEISEWMTLNKLTMTKRSSSLRHLLITSDLFLIYPSSLGTAQLPDLHVSRTLELC